MLSKERLAFESLTVDWQCVQREQCMVMSRYGIA